MKWKTKDGKEIEIKYMETTHIKNCIKILENNLFKCEETINACEDFNDDSYSCYFELNEALEVKKYFLKYIKIFKEELEKRKLNK